MRFRAFVLSTAVAGLAGLASRTAGAQSGGETVTLIPPTPSLDAAITAPTLALPPPPDLSSLAGRPIVAVQIVVEEKRWGEESIATPSSLARGAPLTPSAARRAMTEILASGRFARASIAAEAEGDGVRVTVRLVPRRLVAEVRVDFHGAPIDPDEALREMDLEDGSEIVADELKGAELRIQHDLAVHGYPSATAHVTTRATDDPARVLVFVDVSPGPPRVIDDRRFYLSGASADQVGRTEALYGIGAHDRADERAIDHADTALEQALRSRGYPRAEVTHDLARVDRAGQAPRIELRVRIDTGALVVPRFEGNAHYDADVLTSVLALDTDTNRSPSHLADKIRTFYQKRGFLDAEVRIETRTADATHTAAAVQLIVFQVTEGVRVRVAARTYPCLKLDAIRALSSGGPRSPDDIGNEIDSFLDEDLPGADLLVSPDPRGLAATVGGGGGGSGQVATGALPVPIDLRPSETYVAETYDRAAEHVRELYRNEGFLHAEVGPVQVLRARCDPRSPGRCVAMPLPPVPTDVCAYDRAGLPAPIDPLDSSFTCRPDSTRGVTCAPEVQIYIPVRLGPRTRIWDVAFTGLKSASEREVADAAQLALGDAASTTKVEDARRRIADWYKELGYYYVDVKASIEASTDTTRARIRFDVTEGDRVIVRSILINGLRRTHDGVVRRRVALEVGQPFRTSDARKTQQRIDTLGVFSNTNVGISDAYVPEARKDVIIDVVERDSQYFEARPGFATGEGVRGVLEYGHRNLLGDAWALTLHLEASYLPDFLILDEGVRQNYTQLSTASRIATRDTVTLSWPEVGLGPTFRAQLDGVLVNDLERDFTLEKGAVVGTLYWRPGRELQIGIGPEYEHNFVFLFNGGSIATYLSNNQGNQALNALLRVPDGESNVVGGKLTVTWDGRDNAVNPHRGAYVAASVEQVNSYPVARRTGRFDPYSDISSQPPQYYAQFFRLTQTFAGYLPIAPNVTFASELRLGEVFTLSCRGLGHVPAPPYCTYEDRLFFMGGFDSMRGWQQDSFIPQDYVDQIAAGKLQCTNNQTQCPGVIVRGGNLMVNPRFELRFPIWMPIEGAIFTDIGNLWYDPTQLFKESRRALWNDLKPRADVGLGIRVDTPVGPIVFDYGFNVTPKSYEDFGAFHFAIGVY
jgi:outer membrane protein assembly factor BamA